MIFVFKHTCNTVYIVVINEIICVDISVNTAVSKLSVKRMCNFKIVVVIMALINAFVAFIVCNRVKHIGICPMIVIAVGNLAVEPEIGLFLFANIF